MEPDFKTLKPVISESDQPDLSTLQPDFATLEPVVAPEEPGLIQRIGEDLSKRNQDIVSAWATYNPKDLSGTSLFKGGKAQIVPTLLQMGGGVLGGALDIIKEVATSAFNKIKENPELVEKVLGGDPVRNNIAKNFGPMLTDSLSRTFNRLTDTSVGQAGLQALSDGVESFEVWKQENPKDAKTLEAVNNLVEAVFLVEGGIAGTQLLKQPVKGAISGVKETLAGISERRAASAVAKETENALKAITPKTSELTPTQYEELLSKGKIAPKAGNKPASYILSDAEKDIATRHADLFQEKDPVKTFGKVQNRVAEMDSSIGSFLKDNPVKYDKKVLKAELKKRLEGVSDIMVPDQKALVKSKNKLVDEFVDSLSGDDLHALWEGRKSFDRIAEQQLKAFSGSPTLKKQLVREVRNGAQEFITTRVPEGTYKATMKDMSGLIDILETIGTRGSKERGLSALKLWMKENPMKSKAFEWAIKGAAGVVGIKKLL